MRLSTIHWKAIPLLAIASLLVTVLTLPGCGNTHRAVEGPTVDGELLAHVSAAIRATPYPADNIAYADLKTAREQLGLPEDAGFPGPDKRRLLFAVASRPLFSFGTLFRKPSLGVLGDVLDSRQIETAVGTNFAFSGPGADVVYSDAVLVVRTGQPFAEIADRLSEAGYTRAGNGLLISARTGEPEVLSTVPNLHRFPFQAVGTAGKGVVVFGGSVGAARAAQGGAEAKPTAVAKLIAELPGVSRIARRGGGGPCVVAVGLGEDAAPRQGELRVVVHGKAQANRFLTPFAGRTIESTGFPGPGAQVTFADATAEGNRATVHFSSTDERNVTRLAVEDVAHAYGCQ